MDKTIKTVRGNPLAAEPLGRLLIKFAIPSVLSMLVDALYNIVDQIFIGRGVGYLGIAATTVTFPFVTILLSIATLLGIGGSVYTSMNLGAGKEAEAEKTLGTVFTLSVAIGILFTVICLTFLKPLALAFGATKGGRRAHCPMCWIMPPSFYLVHPLIWQLLPCPVWPERVAAPSWLWDASWSER